MTGYRSVSLALVAAVATSMGVVACGSSESGTTPACSQPDASDCFTLPDGGNSTPPPDAATGQPDAATAD